jgi:SAM-dependent methyltransferase
MNCRSCGLEVSDPILDLGVQPLANAYLTSPDAKEEKYPLRLCVCKHCWLVQLVETVPAEKLFSEYAYFTSASAPMVEHARKCAERYISEFNLNGQVEKGHEKWVVEVASNDGYMLQHFQEAGCACYGIEPAENVGKVARDKGIESVTMFFNKETAYGRGPMYHRKATLLLANNVMAHCEDINDFVSAIRGALTPYGRAILEFPYAVDLFDRGEFDTVYHEHVYYFTLTSLMPLFERHGLRIYRVERIAVHGGALRIFVGTKAYPDQDATVGRVLDYEHGRAIKSMAYYELLRLKASDRGLTLAILIGRLRMEGKTIACYGASAKSTVLLNFVGFLENTFTFICDTTEAKQGRFTPGTHIPILPPEKLVRMMPDYCLVLIWNHMDHVLKTETEYIKKGGKFITVFPEVKVLE